jgi:ADP-ribosylglycohydrolase
MRQQKGADGGLPGQGRDGRAAQDMRGSPPREISPELLRGILTAYSVGDALGMPTEFMTRQEIDSNFGLVDRLLEPGESQNHPNIPQASVTDDTEQICALLDEYAERGRVDAKHTAQRLLRWMRESGAVEKKYIGPSSKAALEAIERGEPPERAGLGGTTCGGVMRSPAATLFAVARGKPLAECVHACLLPTHNTHLALEPAMGYAYALRAAMLGESDETILAEMESGAIEGARRAPYPMCGPSLAARVSDFTASNLGARLSTARNVQTQAGEARFQTPVAAGVRDDIEATLDFIYTVYGTTLASVDVASAALCIFLTARDDTWLAVRMGASVGGDTDTIAALAGALSAARAIASGRPLNIPDDVVGEVLQKNRLDFGSLIGRLLS